MIFSQFFCFCVQKVSKCKFVDFCAPTAKIYIYIFCDFSMFQTQFRCIYNIHFTGMNALKLREMTHVCLQRGHVTAAAVRVKSSFTGQQEYS